MEPVVSGNLNAEVATTSSRDEISSLSRTFSNMVNKINHLISEIQVIQKRESGLRFEMLLTQINPYLLFNTLDFIKWMSMVSGTDHITVTITFLGRLFEISMNKVNDVSPLGEELENIRSYVQIQQVRYPGRSDVSHHINDPLLNCRTLKLVLQSFVENSILYNTEHRSYPSINISGEFSEDLTISYAKDNGIGMTKEQVEQILESKTHVERGYVLSGLGICNVEERIRLAYDPNYGLEYSSDGYSYTEVATTFLRYQKSGPLLRKETKQ